jgi:hypothetical protein
MEQNYVYVDDERNADVRTGRPGTRRPPPSGRPYSRAPSSSSALAPQGYLTTAPGYMTAPPGYMTAPPYWNYPPPSFASRFGMTTGELIDTGIQILAAIQPIPGAPTAQGEATVDVENLTLYQQALATYAKRDEQLRTLGNLLVRILR